MCLDDQLRTTSELSNYGFGLCHKAWEYLKSFLVNEYHVQESNNGDTEDSNAKNNTKSEPKVVAVRNSGRNDASHNRRFAKIASDSNNNSDFDSNKKPGITDVRKRKSVFKVIPENFSTLSNELARDRINKHDIARQEVKRLIDEKSTKKYGKYLNLKKQTYSKQQQLRNLSKNSSRNNLQFLNFGNVTTFAHSNKSLLDDSYTNFYNNNRSYNHNAMNLTGRMYPKNSRTLNDATQLFTVANRTTNSNNTLTYPNDSNTSCLLPNTSAFNTSGILNSSKSTITMNGANKKLFLNSRAVGSSNNDDLRIVKIKKIARRDNHISDIANNYLKNFQYKSYQDILKSKRELQRQIEQRKDIFLQKSRIQDLNSEQYAKVKKFWDFQGGSNIIICTINNIDIRITDLKTLKNGEWLNDNIIDSYLSMIVNRNNSSKGSLPQIFVFTTHFFTTLQAKGYNGVRRWAMRKKINVLELDYIFVPINIMNSHWTLAIINNKEKKFQYYDSLPGSHDGNAIMENLAHYMNNERKRLLGNMDVKHENEYDFQNCNNGPKQKNGFDCGVFACMEIEYLARESPLNFGQNDMLTFRKRMAYELITEKLL